jgi:hypothetical protein
MLINWSVIGKLQFSPNNLDLDEIVEHLNFLCNKIERNKTHSQWKYERRMVVT